MKRAVSLLLVLILLAAGTGCSGYGKAYENAQSMLDSGDYTAAETAFSALGDYKDSGEKVRQCRYLSAKAQMEKGEFAPAASAFSELGEYSDAPELARECVYQEAERLMQGGMLEEAAAQYATVPGYKDADEKRTGCESELKYARAAALLGSAKNSADTEAVFEAISLFSELGGYKDSAALLEESCFLAGDMLIAGENVRFPDCQRALALYAQSGALADGAPEKLAYVHRLTLWSYVRENGIDTVDSADTPCRKLVIADRNSTGSTGVVTQERLTVFAYQDIRMGISREEAYESGGTTYSESFELRLELSAPEQADVFARSYTDLGVFSAYISEVFSGTADIGALKTKADIAVSGYVKQAHQISGKNIQSMDYNDQISIDKILRSLPDFMDSFDAAFSSLPFTVTTQAMGFARPETVAETETGNAGDSMPGENFGNTASGIREPETEEMLEYEQDVLCIFASGAALYAEPDRVSAILYTAEFGETMTAFAATEGWLYVRYGSDSYGWAEVGPLFGKWMFDTDVNPALSGLTAPRKCALIPTVISTTDKANVRSGPDSKEKLLGSYITGSQCVLVGTTDLWYFVNFDGVYGWVHKNNFK